MKKYKSEFLVCTRSWLNEDDVRIIDSFSRTISAENKAKKIFDPDILKGKDAFVITRKMFKLK